MAPHAELGDVDRQEGQKEGHRKHGCEGAENADGEIASPVDVVIRLHQDFFGLVSHIVWRPILVYQDGRHKIGIGFLSIEGDWAEIVTQMQEMEDKLRRMILDMEIGPGERLTERWVEGQLGASRTSVRTALFRLEAEGLVSRDGRGWIVPPIDLEEIDQLFTYRAVLETAAIRLGGAKAHASDLNDIEAVLDSVDADASPDLAHRAGQDFHVRIARLSGNDFITRAVSDAMTRLSRVRWLESNPKHRGWDEHRAVLNAIRDKEIDLAIKLIEAHIIDTRDRLIASLQGSRRSLRARGIGLKAET
ncbi:GntR family transcriptional regulator [Acidisoma cellulosilytica]|uniref:GntR family transcriptional regulator n=1 Tax=Acidisoma cellulosilyticum TaxID=2802395 RepID=A0A963Z1Q4_9PROT|nr:GntR family transcriptional regulator [Acidisoma cellulosilyticum]MCB8881089.1 GntR family transcriptional regulator [Acidisoma cellulosilyticum]